MGQEGLAGQQGGAPYPPPQGGVTAPGGYPVVSPGAGPSSGPPPTNYPPQPTPAAMEPPVKPSAAGHTAAPGPYPPQGPYPPAGPGPYPPAGPGPYPGAAPYPHGGAPHGYPPQPGAGPAPGYPVVGPQGGPAYGGMVVEQAGQPTPGQEPCGCSIGWVLFGVGFFIWPCWVAAAFVPLCTRSRNDRLAGIASTIGLLVLVILGIIIGATQGSRNRAMMRMF